MPIALEDGNFIRISSSQAERQRSLSAITRAVSARAGRVERYLGHWIASADAWNQVANILACRDHRAVGLPGRIRARHVYVSALLNSCVATRIDAYTGRQALVHTTKIDDEHAVDEYERVVVAEELQLEWGTVVREQVASLDRHPGIVEPALRIGDPRAIRILPNHTPGLTPGAKLGGKTYWSALQPFPAPNDAETVPVWPDVAEQRLVVASRRCPDCAWPGGAACQRIKRKIVSRRIEGEEPAVNTVRRTREPEQIGRASYWPQLERYDLVRVVCVAAIGPPLTEAGCAGRYRRWPFIQRMAVRSRDVRERVERTVRHGVTRHMAAVRVVTPIRELTITQERVRAAAVAGGVVCRMTSGVQVCLRHSPAA